MIKYKTITVQEEIIESATCDVCGKTLTQSDIGTHGEMGFQEEFQEWHRIRTYGGYGSIIGDGAKIECDICQECFSKLLGPYLRINYQD